jgi:hypothetical protein
MTIKVLVDEDDVLQATADAIREKKSVSTLYKPNEMAAAITSISGSLPWGLIELTDKTTTYDVSDYSYAIITDLKLIPENIKKDVTILGVTGLTAIETGDATADASKIKEGKKGWVNGALLTGTAKVTVTGTTLNLPN